MSALLDIIVGFIAALVSAAFLHFGAGSAPAQKHEPVPAATPAQNQIGQQAEADETGTAPTETTLAENTQAPANAPAKTKGAPANSDAALPVRAEVPSARVVEKKVVAPAQPRAPQPPHTDFALPVAPPAPPALSFRIADAQNATRKNKIEIVVSHDATEVATEAAMLAQIELRLSEEAARVAQAAQRNTPKVSVVVTARDTNKDAGGACPQQDTVQAVAPHIRTFVGS